MNPNPFISWVWILTVINVTLCNALWTYFCQKCGNPTYFNVYDVCVCARERERPHLRYAATRADVRDHSSGSAPGRWSNVMTLYQCHDIVTTLTLSHASQSQCQGLECSGTPLLVASFYSTYSGLHLCSAQSWTVLGSYPDVGSLTRRHPWARCSCTSSCSAKYPSRATVGGLGQEHLPKGCIANNRPFSCNLVHNMTVWNTNASQCHNFILAPEFRLS